MKKIHFLIALVCFGFSVHAQINFVPNPSFEDTAIGCPNNSGQISRAKHWFTVNGSPDYFNRCYNGPSNYNTIPNNSFTYQEVSVGGCNAYSGIYTAAPGFNNINEIFGIKLMDSLVTGVKYFFTLKLSLSNFCKYGTNNMGALLSTNQPSATGTASPNNFCQINFNQVITDTLNWTKLFKSFTADSNYKFLRIGNFMDSSLTSKILVNNASWAGNRAYYTIDDICISTDSSFTYNYSYNCLGTSIKENDEYNFNIFPNPSTDIINIEGLNEEHFFSIIDFTGRQLINSNLNNYINKVDISIYNNGVYILKIFDRSKNIIGTKKLIILKP